jgi:hypothetical protein
MTPEDLDAVLAMPLPVLDDCGFSAAVTARIAAAQEFRTRLVLLGLAAVAGMLLIFIPLSGLDAAIETVAVNLGSSLPVAIAFAVLVLSNSFARLADAG